MKTNEILNATPSNKETSPPTNLFQVAGVPPIRVPADNDFDTRKRNESYISRAKEFADKGLGLYFPKNLNEALDDIAKKNNLPWGVNSTRETVAYFIGQSFFSVLYHDDFSYTTPFDGVSKLSIDDIFLKKENNILLLGSSGYASYLKSYDALKRNNIKIKEHCTIDISPFPINIIKEAGQIHPERDKIIIQDAKMMGFNEHFDIVMTDFFFGSQTADEERTILSNIHKSLTESGHFILRATAGIKENLELMRYEIGAFWRGIAVSRYGETNNKDNYIGLTNEQWIELGKLYIDFSLKMYHGNNQQNNILNVLNLIKWAGKDKMLFIVQEMKRFNNGEWKQLSADDIIKNPGVTKGYFVINFKKYSKNNL